MSNASVPVSFLDFLDALDIVPTRAQRVLWAVAADGVQPLDLDENDHALSEAIFGPVEAVPAEARQRVAVVKGARIGGTMMASYRLVHLALTVPLPKLARREHGFALVIAPDMKTAKQGLNYIAGALEHHDLAPMVVSEKSDSIIIKRPDGRIIEFAVLAASHGGRAERGRSLVGALLDEASFFYDENYAVNDVTLYQAVAPRIVPGGQLLVVSTPWCEKGLLYSLHRENFANPSSCLCALAPTPLMRTDDPMLLGFVEHERVNDPENCSREYLAEFLSGGAGQFFDANTIRAALDEDAHADIPYDQRFRHYLGVDLGLVHDSSVGIVVRLSKDGKNVEVCHIRELRPARGEPLKLAETCETLSEVAEFYHCVRVVADQFYFQSLREHLAKRKLTLSPAPAGAAGKHHVYYYCRQAMREGQLRIPNEPRLLLQLRSIVATPTSGGVLTIKQPRRAGGGHGDLVSALTLATWAAQRLAAASHPPYPPGRRTIIGAELAGDLAGRNLGNQLGPGSGGIDFEVLYNPHAFPPGGRRGGGGNTGGF